MPYAVAVGVVGCIAYIPAALGINVWLLLALSVAILCGMIMVLGRRVE